VGFVDVGVAEDLADAVEDRELLGARFDSGTGGLELVVAPMADPGLAEDVTAKAAVVIPVIGDEGAILRDACESVRAGAGSDDRYAAREGGVELGEGGFGTLAET